MSIPRDEKIKVYGTHVTEVFVLKTLVVGHIHIIQTKAAFFFYFVIFLDAGSVGAFRFTRLNA